MVVGLAADSHSFCPVQDVRATVLRASADLSDIDSSSETLLIEVIDEEGRVGIGEADTASHAARAIVEMEDLHAWNAGLRGALVGHDPFLISAMWRRMEERTQYVGPSGVARHAMAGVDVALHDLAGQQCGRPIHHLLGGSIREANRPYATVYAGSVNGRSTRALMDSTLMLMERALAEGFRAVKMEVIFQDAVTDAELVECIREGRRLVGDDVTMLVDFGYRWRHWRDALWVISRVSDCDLWLVEAPLQHSDLEGYARLGKRIEPRLGGAELASTLRECADWIQHAKVDVLQPDISRAGGLTEMLRIAQYADLHGVEVVPHNWKTGINAAAARHLQASSPNVPLFEMTTPDLFPSRLRRDLVGPEPKVVDGFMDLPTAPGLGVTLNRSAVDRYAHPTTAGR